MVVIVTLVPFDFTRPPGLRILWTGNPGDAVANVLMFLPLGFLYRLTTRADRDRAALAPLLLGLLLSLGVESAQLLLPSRFASPLDVLANGTGAWLGALVHDRVARRIAVTPRLVGALALELPLMGLVYLLVPLLWLHGLASSGEPGRMATGIPIALVGAVVLGAVHRHRLGPGGATTPGQISLAAGAWFVIAAVPSLTQRPVPALLVALGVIGFTRLVVLERVPAGRERRFEGETLARSLPLLGLFLLLLIAWPPSAHLTGWHARLGIRGLWAETGTSAILRVLEYLAAFTVLGYALAETRGRREESLRQALPFLLTVAGTSAIGLEAIAALQAGPGASGLRALLASAASLYGASLYHLQRDHVRWLLRDRAIARPLPASPRPPPGRRPGTEPATNGSLPGYRTAGSGARASAAPAG